MEQTSNQSSLLADHESSAHVDHESTHADHESVAHSSLPSSTSAPCLPDSVKRMSTPISVPSHIRFYKQAEHDRQNLLRCGPSNKVKASHAQLGHRRGAHLPLAAVEPVGG